MQRSNLSPVITLTLVAMVVGLSYQNRALRAQLQSTLDEIQATASPSPETTPSDLQGTSAPVANLRTRDGDAITLGHEGVPTFVAFFSTQCPACEEDATTWSNLHRDYHAAGVRFVGVCVGDNADRLDEFAKDHELEFHLVSTETEEVADHYRVDFLPRRVIIDAGGTIRHADSPDLPLGIEGEAQLRRALDQLLEAENGPSTRISSHAPERATSPSPGHRCAGTGVTLS